MATNVLYKKMLTLFLVFTSAYATTYFSETFEDDSKWVESSTRHDEDKMGSFVLTDDQKLKTDQDARYYTMFAPMDKPVSQDERDFVVQYSIKLDNTDFKCGGAYLKLLETAAELETINHETPYKLMFGPDFSCNSKSKVHAIFSDTQWSESTDASVLSDGEEHSFALVLRPDNTYSYYVDRKELRSGDMEDAWPLLEPRKINDPAESKPSDWPLASILDVDDVKPDGYDDIPKTIVDFESMKPDDWDDDEDGGWEPAEIPNPAYKGPWTQRKIPNPAYKGPWVHPEIPNPDYVPNATIYKQVSGANVIGFELWNFDSGVLFDNIIVSDEWTFTDDQNEFSNTGGEL